MFEKYILKNKLLHFWLGCKYIPIESKIMTHPKISIKWNKVPIIQLLDKCMRRSNKNAPLWYACLALLSTCVKVVQFYLSRSYPAIPYWISFQFLEHRSLCWTENSLQPVPGYIYSKSSNCVHFCPKNSSLYSKLHYLNRDIERNRTNFTLTSNILGPKS